MFFVAFDKMAPLILFQDGIVVFHDMQKEFGIILKVLQCVTLHCQMTVLMWRIVLVI